MKTLRLMMVAALFALIGIMAAEAQPAPVPALPDAPRLTSYSLTGSTCTCSVGFALYGDGTDYQSWVEVYINGALTPYNSSASAWAITSPSGALSSIARPVTDAVLTFALPQTGTVEIVGARRPRRTTQFQEGVGVPARSLNQSLTDIVAQNRETWDKINDVTGRGLFYPPGNTTGPMPLPTQCESSLLGFDATGLNPSCYPLTTGTLPTIPQIAPVVQTNAMLIAWATAGMTPGLSQIIRTGFYAAGDSPQEVFTLQSGTCAANGMTADNGSCANNLTGNSWKGQLGSLIDVRDFGVVVDWNGTTGTDNNAAWTAAINYACVLGTGKGGFFVIVTDGSIANAIAEPISIKNCFGIAILANIHALASSSWNDGRVVGGTTWTDGNPVTKTANIIVPANTTPNQSIAGVWNPTRPWPSVSVSSVTNFGGLYEIQTSSTHGLATGNKILITGAGGNSALNNTWTVTVVDTTHVTLQGSTYASGYTSGGTVWDGVPFGMFTIEGSSYGIKFLDNSKIDCAYVTACVPIANYGLSETFNILAIDNVVVENYSTAGLFTCGAGTQVYVRGGIFLQTTSASGRGYGNYWTCGTSDDWVTAGTTFAENYQAFLVDAGSIDIHYSGSHMYNGAIAGFTTNYYPDIEATFVNKIGGPLSGGTLDSMTWDSGQVVLQALDNGFGACFMPQLQITGNWNYAGFHGLIADAPIIAVPASTCTVAHLSSSSSANSTNLGIDPNQLASVGNSAPMGSYQFGGILALEDSNGNGPGNQLYDNVSLQQAAMLNSNQAIGGNQIVNLQSGPATTATSFTGNLTIGSQTISVAQIMPTPGTTITDSAGCLPAGTVVGSIDYFNDGIYVPQTPTCTASTKVSPNMPDTLTIGGKTFTANVTAGNHNILAVSFPAIRKGMSISDTTTPTNIPANSFVDSYNPNAGTIVFHNAGGSGAAASATGDTLSLNPLTYELQIDDQGLLLLMDSVNNRSLYLPQGSMLGWSTALALGSGVEHIIPEGSATINGATGTQTLNTTSPYARAQITAFALPTSTSASYITDNSLGTGPKGNVTGPASSVGGDLAGFSGTTGQILLDTGVNVTATGSPVLAFGSSSNTFTFPANTGTLAEVGFAQTWTAVQTFTNSDIRLLGSSTGYTTFMSANAGASNYTLTIPAATDTIGELGQANAWTGNETHSGTEVFTGSQPTMAAGTTAITGGTVPTIGANGEAVLASNTTNGARLVGQGSTYDVSWGNNANTSVLGVLTGTSVIKVVSAGTAANPSLAIGNSTTGVYSASTTGLGASVNGSSILDYGITTGSVLTLPVATTISTATLILSGITTDSAKTTRTVCQQTSNSQIFFGSGTGGICAGTSGEQFKHDIRNEDSRLELAALDIPQKAYQFNPGLGYDPNRDYHAFTAQTVLPFAPDCVGKDEKGTPISVDHLCVVDLIIGGLKLKIGELQSANDNLEHRLEAPRKGKNRR